MSDPSHTKNSTGKSQQAKPTETATSESSAPKTKLSIEEQVQETKGQFDVLRKVYERDLFRFAKEVLGYDKLCPKLHGWIIQQFVDKKNFLLLIPRDHFKTTVVTISATIWDIIKNPNMRIYVANAVLGEAQKFLREIKGHMEQNPILKMMWPDIFYANPHKNSPKWTEDEIIVKRKVNKKEATITVGSVGKIETGSHFDKHVYDDLVNMDNVATPELIQKTLDWYRMSLAMLEPHGSKIVVGTRYDYCLVGKTKILMADWSHKEIKDIMPDDVVVGWELRDGKRYLVPSRVTAIGKYENRAVNRYVFDNCRSVACTPEHKWWKGPWTSGAEYKSLGLHHNKMKHACRLLVPLRELETREAGWLERYRFLAQIAPTRSKKIASSLFAQMTTKQDKLIEIHDEGKQDVYWFQCESGNYIADGYCSKNSDLYGSLIEGGMRHVKLDCGLKRNRPILPTRWNLQALRNKKREIGSYMFSSQYENDPIDEDTADFKRKFMKYWDREDLKKKQMNYYILIDLAVSQKDQACETAMEVVGFTDLGEIYCLQDVSGKFTPVEVMDNLYRLYRKYNKPQVGIERMQAERVLSFWLQERAKKEGLMIPYHQLKPDMDKDRRIRNLVPFWEQGKILLAPHMPELESQFLRFPRYRKKDRIDALAYIVQLAVRPTNRKNSQKFKADYGSIWEKLDDKIRRHGWKPQKDDDPPSLLTW